MHKALDDANYIMNKLRQPVSIPTPILDYEAPSIQALINQKGWRSLPDFDRIKTIYDFVRNDISFGYNRDDAIPASAVLKDGYGQCNTKTTLLMALLRAVGLQCRFHGFTIDKSLQKGAVTGLWYWLAPKDIIHSWVEVWYQDKWHALEGVILDEAYLTRLQQQFKNFSETFCGYGVYTDSFKNPPVEWAGDDTYIQNLGISQDFGVFDTPDSFYKKHGSNMHGIKLWVYDTVIRKQINRTIARIRQG